MEDSSRYFYPTLDAEFGQYNFHRPAMIENLAELIASADPHSPRIIQLVGPPQSGRHYLLRAAAFKVEKRGVPAAVTSLDLNGYEPDQPWHKLIEYLAKNAQPPQKLRLLNFANKVKAELKVTVFNYLGTSLAIKWDPTLEELGRLIQSDPRPVGPSKSERQQFGELLDRLTKNQRLILHVRVAHILDVGLRDRLIDEARLNSNLFVALSYPEGALRQLDEPTHRVLVPQWNRKEMEQAISRDFSGARIPAAFIDFLWNSSHSRESLASLLLRSSTVNGVWAYRNGAYLVESFWQRNEHLLKEFARDLFAPIEELLLSTADSKHQTMLRDFVNMAALCDPTIPVKQIVAT